MKIKERRKKNSTARNLRALKVTLRNLRGLAPRPTLGDLVAADLIESSRRVGFATRFLCKVKPSAEEVSLLKTQRSLAHKVVIYRGRNDEVRVQRSHNAWYSVTLRLRELERIRFNKV